MVEMITHKLTPEVSQNPRLRAASRICEKLQSHGFEAWWVGGCVRDFLLTPDVAPQDIDIATNASFNETKTIFPTIHAIGKAFGVGLLQTDGYHFEIATFRKESGYVDRRHPSQVGPGSMEEDSVRRDFTINALYYDPLKGIIADFHGGIEDIANKTLRCVGDARNRLHEDPLRIFRLYRFSANLGLSIEDSTRDAASDLVQELTHISKERFLLEISKLRPDAVDSFAKLVQKALTQLTGVPKSTSTALLSPLTLPDRARRHPGSVLAILCARQCFPIEFDWAKQLSNWPLTLEDKAHIEFMSYVSNSAFEIADNREHPIEFLIHMRWLFRQNRIRTSDAVWIAQATPVHTKRPQSARILEQTLQQIAQQTPECSLSESMEDFIGPSAKLLRKELALLCKDKPPETLGWARLILDVTILLDAISIEADSRPAVLHKAESSRLEYLCQSAETFARTSKKRRG